MDYLHLRRFSAFDSEPLERFVFEAAARLEQTAALQAQVKAFLIGQGVSHQQDGAIRNATDPRQAGGSDPRSCSCRDDGLPKLLRN